MHPKILRFDCTLENGEDKAVVMCLFIPLPPLLAAPHHLLARPHQVPQAPPPHPPYLLSALLVPVKQHSK